MAPAARHGGRKREVFSEVINAISRCCRGAANALPKDLPPKSTAHDYFILLDRSPCNDVLTLAWISRNRRLARDFEHCETTVATFVRRAKRKVRTGA